MEKKLPLYLTLLGNVKKIVRFFSKFCGLLRISELWHIKNPFHNTCKLWNDHKSKSFSIKVEITYVVWACYLPCLGSSHLFRHRKSSIFGVGTTSLVVFPIFFNNELSVKEKKRKSVINTYDFLTKIARLWHVRCFSRLMIDSSTSKAETPI